MASEGRREEGRRGGRRARAAARDDGHQDRQGRSQEKRHPRPEHRRSTACATRPIKQVTVNCQTATGPVSWRLDTSDSQDWPRGRSSAAGSSRRPTCSSSRRPATASRKTSRSTSSTRTTRTPTPTPRPRCTPMPSWPSTPRPRRHAARCLGLPDRRRDALWQARRDRPGHPAVHDALAGQAGDAAVAGRRRAHRPARSQGVARLVRQAAQVARVGRPAAGADQERRGRGHPGRRRGDRRRPAAISLPRQDPDDLAQAGRGRGHGVADGIRQPDELRPTFTLPDSVVISGKWKDLDTSTWKIVTSGGRS